MGKPMDESMHYVHIWHSKAFVEHELAFEASIASLRIFGLRIAESTWRVAEGSYFAFCSSVLSLEGIDQVGEKREQAVHRREVSRRSTMSPNDPEHDDAEGWCKTAKNYTKGRIAELIGDFD
ncbi:hypothetical protein H5410_056640 [Solanum commersonii]|uniref:Uncharacterized protein n=1 Tax=Solanum commersonii TaxID=4109 RepID=A0A9J5WLW6_SOLCO|nr:hypothetical protein H5410_056640 [Solanum commersonii]